MFYTPSERVGIGKRVFAHEITKEKVAREYSFSIQNVHKTLTTAKKHNHQNNKHEHTLLR